MDFSIAVRTRHHIATRQMVGIIEPPPALQSASGILALLDEQDPTIQHYALEQLNTVVDLFWAEISDNMTKIEELTEDETNPDRELASLLASKVFYHLNALDESTSFALRAGQLLDIDSETEYTQTIVAHCIDKYTEQSQKGEKVEQKLVVIVERMLQRCFRDNQWKQAVGVVIEARRLDWLRDILCKSDQDLKRYVFEICMLNIRCQQFRNETLSMLVSIFLEDKVPDFFTISKCVVHLNDFDTAANLLNRLMVEDLIVAYQIAFDLASSATQEFLSTLSSKLSECAYSDKVKSVLSGKETIDLHLEFLARNNQTDILALTRTKDTLDARNLIFHSSVTFANAFMHAGTTSDGFFRNNLEWLSKATNWSKFSATAALGVIHRGNLSQGMQLLSPYLPSDESGNSSPYSQGGSLYALGLIFANHGLDVQQYLEEKLKGTVDETVQHGAALGIGIAGMATASEDLYETLKNVLFMDSAVAGEAAGLAMGLVMLGTANQKAVDEMLQYAHETQHEKIIRGLAIGMCLIMYAKEDAAETLIDQLLQEQEPILRYGGIFTIAMAYCGTANNASIRKVLHVAVSDANDDVRRAAIMSLGFIMFRNHTAVPRMVQLLSESYNPHMRYGSTMALGISCAGTGSTDAVDVIEPLLKDPVDFVRQGAMIALGMILMQQNESTSPKVLSVRKIIEKVIGEKHEDAMAKFGAVLALGIIDAGGRNATLSLESVAGSLNLQAVVGMLVFTQYWHWFPLTHFLSLAFTPTAIIGLNKDLLVPEIKFWSNTAPSLFAYPPKTEISTEKAPERLATAVLSTTARAKARAKKSKVEKEDIPMDIDADIEAKTQQSETSNPHAAMKVDTEQTEKITHGEPESRGFEVNNLTRVLPQHLQFISFPENCRYYNVRNLLGGVVMLFDNRPDEDETFIEVRSRIQEKKQEPIADAAPASEEMTHETDTEL